MKGTKVLTLSVHWPQYMKMKMSKHWVMVFAKIPTEYDDKNEHAVTLITKGGEYIMETSE